MLVNPRYHTFFDGTVSESLPFTRNDGNELRFGDIVKFTDNNIYVYNGEYWELLPVTRYYTDFIIHGKYNSETHRDLESSQFLKQYAAVLVWEQYDAGLPFMFVMKVKVATTTYPLIGKAEEIIVQDDRDYVQAFKDYLDQKDIFNYTCTEGYPFIVQQAI